MKSFTDKNGVDGYDWYMAGRCHGSASLWMAQARSAVYPEVRALHVQWARSDHRRAMLYLKLARSRT
jgi:hypothetical protein